MRRARLTGDQGSGKTAGMARTPPVFVTDAPDLPSASNPALEAQLRAAPDDVAAAQVYADWLIEHGDPRGELASAQIRGDASAAGALLAQHGGWLAGVSPQVATIDWRPGRFRKLRLMNLGDWMSSQFDTALVAQRLLTQPAANCLEELAVGVLRWEYMAQDVTTLLDAAAATPLASGLRRLTLGDCHDIDIDIAHHELGDLPDLSRFPALEALSVWGFAIGLAPLRLPKLRSLSIETCGLSTAALEAVLSSELPSLTELTLWFGSEDYGSECGVADLAPLLDGSALPSVRELGLCNAEFTDALVTTLVASPILARLRGLDLSLGTLTNAGADVLIAAADRWKHLEYLDVNDNFLTEDRLAALRAVGPEIRSDEQKDVEGDGEDMYLYVSVAE